MSEFDLVNIIISFFKSQNYIIYKEVPNMGQSADIVALKGVDTYVVEAKIKDWNRAIRQCKTHEVVADYIYIGIASKNISDKLLSAAKSNGYGIIHYDEEKSCCYYYLRPEKNRNTWLPQKEIFMKHLNYDNHVS
jgi:hypothetical protein